MKVEARRLEVIKTTATAEEWLRLIGAAAGFAVAIIQVTD